MAEFTMPSLGADMEEGTLLEWLVKPGDTVHKGDVVAVVDTAKSAVEVEAFDEGVVGALLVEPGTTVPVGTPLATITTPGERADVTTAASPAEAVPDDTVRAAEAAAPSSAKAREPQVRATPYARRLAAELGVDLAAVPVPDGQPVRASDVQAAADGAAAAEQPVVAETDRAPEVVAQATMRETIAAVMSRAKREIPHYYLSTTVDLARALDWMHERNRGLEVSRRIVPAALMLKATALATAATPAVNGFWIDGGFRPAQGVHLGIAISLRGGGLVAPALHDTADLSLDAVMAGMRDLVSRARSGRLRSSELSDSTLTVTNLGDQGVESVFGVIYPPQVALVGFGRVVDKPCAVGGLLGVRPTTTMTLSADHRATDGFTGGRFLAAVDAYLQEPETL